MRYTFPSNSSDVDELEVEEKVDSFASLASVAAALAGNWGAVWGGGKVQEPAGCDPGAGGETQAVFGYGTKFFGTFFEKRISYAWSTKWSLFAKPFQGWV